MDERYEILDTETLKKVQEVSVPKSDLLSAKAGCQRDIETCYQEIKRLQDKIAEIDSLLALFVVETPVEKLGD